MSCESIACIHTKDRISDFPDAIILRILSFADAKTAVKTGFFSKRFANLWTEAPCLNFDEASLDFIYTTLCFHNRFNLEKVSILLCNSFRNNADGKDKFCRCIQLLCLARLKELVLELEDPFYILPQHFYLNPFLEKLTIKRCPITAKGFIRCRISIICFINWKSLQNLSLASMTISDDTINKVLSGCPCLEFLNLSTICLLSKHWQPRINLADNKCLRKMVIDRYEGEEETLEILAPNFQSLVLTGLMEMFSCRVLNANSLTDCVIDFYENKNYPDNYDMLKTLLDDLSHVEVVTIGEWVLDVVTRNKLPCPMSKAIKCLKIRTNLRNFDMKMIECVLRNLNRLETLSVEFGDYDNKYILTKSYWTSNRVETKVDLKLKKMKFWYLKANTQFQCAVDQVLLLAKFVLENGKLMENLSVSVRGSHHKILKLENTLLEFPRSSPNATIKIQDW